MKFDQLSLQRYVDGGLDTYRASLVVSGNAQHLPPCSSLDDAISQLLERLAVLVPREA